MLRKALAEVQGRAAQRGSAFSQALWHSSSAKSAQTELLQPARHRQAIAAAADYAADISWGFQGRGFAAQADQEQSATSPPEQQASSEAAEAEAAAEEVSAAADADSAGSEPVHDDVNSYEDLSPEELRSALQERDASLEAQTAEIQQYKDRLIRTLADMENARQRSAQQAENSKRFAVQGFAKAMLDVADNLERAIGIVESRSEDSEELDLEKVQTLLTSLNDGVKLTDKILLQAFQQNGLERLNPVNESFDPNLHNALFEAPMPGKEPGTIHTVIKAGYTLNGRVLRAAEVGVTPSH